jgi:hypothetical protein
MREYALNDAIALGEYSEYGKIPLATRLFRNWQARRRLSRLADRDERVLHTMGVTREQVCRAIALPLTINAERALEVWAFRAAVYNGAPAILEGAKEQVVTKRARQPLSYPLLARPVSR